MDQDNPQQSIHVDELDNVHLSELTQHCTACEDTTSDYSKSHVSFTDLINAANQLVQTVTNDKKMDTKVYSTIKQWTIKPRRKEEFHIVFQNMEIINNGSPEKIIDLSAKDPLPASTKYAPVSSAKKRKKILIVFLTHFQINPFSLM